MICLQENGRMQVFDLRRVKLETSNYKLEMEYGLEEGKYLILRDGGQMQIVAFGHRQDRQGFIVAMRGLSRKMDEVPSEFDPLILKNFIKADTDHNLELSKDEIKVILAELKLEYNDDIKNILKYIRKAHKITTEDITYRDFEKLAKTFSCRLEMLKVYENYTKVKSTYYSHYLQKAMTRQQFQSFLQYQQHEKDPTNVQKIIEMVFGTNPKINFYEFSQFLISPLNTSIDNTILSEEENLKMPLTDYYCYSSHNTYLTGNQLTSDSRAERYWEDLEDGLRCVELDTHDGLDGPIIKHGFTMTSAISFSAAIRIINQFSKQNPKHTPIILSLQNHCSNANQLKMAHILQQSFGQKLLHVLSNSKFPTLQECLGKIIVKASGNMNVYHKYVEVRHSDKSDIDIEQQEEQDDYDPNVGQTVLFGLIGSLSTYPQQFLKHKKVFEESVIYLRKDKIKFHKQQIIVQKFIRSSFQHQQAHDGKHRLNLKLLSITSILGTGKLGQPNAWESVSISQSKLMNYYGNDKDKLLLLMHSRVGWLRSYPLASRVDSSNYNPIPCLQMGVQLVALNTQSSDQYTLILRRFFDKGKNKALGYRLKSNRIYTEQTLKNQNEMKKISITPLSASKIFYNYQKPGSVSSEIPQVQVKMSFIGSSSDSLLNKAELQHQPCTEIVKGNGFNPIFKYGKRFTVRYRDPEFAFVYLQIERCGISIVPLESIRKGYRSIVLYDEQLNVKESKILCHVE